MRRLAMIGWCVLLSGCGNAGSRANVALPAAPPPAPAIAMLPAGPSGPLPRTAYVSDGSSFITIFSGGQIGGDIAPSRTLIGSDPAHGAIDSLAVDAAGNLYAAYLGPPGKVAVWSAGATGSAAPARELFPSPALKLNSVRVDGSGRIAAATDRIAVYAAGASGNAAPLRTFSVPASETAGTVFLAGFDASGNAYVLSGTGLQSFITVFAPDADAAATPLRTIAFPDAGALQLSSAAVDLAGNVYLSSAGPANAVVVYATALADPNAAPARTISGDRTFLKTPFGVAVDAAGDLYVADFGCDLVPVFAPGANGNVPPAAFIGGSNTLLHFPEAIAVSP